MGTIEQLFVLLNSVTSMPIKEIDFDWGGDGIILCSCENKDNYIFDDGFYPKSELILHKKARQIGWALVKVLEIITKDKRIPYCRGLTILPLIKNLSEEKPCEELVRRAIGLTLSSLELKIVFSYGANMNRIKFKNERCSRAIFLGNEILTNYEFCINKRGVATILEQEGAFVEGVIWALDNDDLKSLNRFEGIAQGLYTLANVVTKSGLEVAVYLATEDTKSPVSREDYFRDIIRSAKENGLSLDYIQKLENYPKSVQVSMGD